MQGITSISNATDDLTNSSSEACVEEHEQQADHINGQSGMVMQVLGQRLYTNNSPQENLPRAQLCIDTIKKSIVKIHLLESPTGDVIKCGSGCVVDSALGLVITGGRVLIQLAYLRRIKKVPDHSVMPVVELAPRSKSKGASGSSSPDEETSNTVHRRLFTAVMVLCHNVNHQEVCILRLGQNIDLSSTIRREKEAAEAAEKKAKKEAPDKKKKRFPLVAALISCMKGKPKAPRDTIPLPIVLYPISYSQLFALPEIRITDSSDISDPDIIITGYFSGRRKPFWGASKFFKIRDDNERSSSKSKNEKKEKYNTLWMDSKFTLDTQIVGSVFINADGEIVGLVCNYVHMESGFALAACRAGYYVIGAEMLKKLLEKARRKCNHHNLRH